MAKKTDGFSIRDLRSFVCKARANAKERGGQEWHGKRVYTLTSKDFTYKKEKEFYDIEQKKARSDLKKKWLANFAGEIFYNVSVNVGSQVGTNLTMKGLNFGYEKACNGYDKISKKLWKQKELSFREKVYQGTVTGVKKTWNVAKKVGELAQTVNNIKQGIDIVSGKASEQKNLTIEVVDKRKK